MLRPGSVPALSHFAMSIVTAIVASNKRYTPKSLMRMFPPPKATPVAQLGQTQIRVPFRSSGCNLSLTPYLVTSSAYSLFLPGSLALDSCCCFDHRCVAACVMDSYSNVISVDMIETITFNQSQQDPDRPSLGFILPYLQVNAQEKLLKEFHCGLCRKVLTDPLLTPCGECSDQGLLRLQPHQGLITSLFEPTPVLSPPCSLLPPVPMPVCLHGVISGIQGSTKTLWLSFRTVTPTASPSAHSHSNPVCNSPWATHTARAAQKGELS